MPRRSGRRPERPAHWCAADADGVSAGVQLEVHGGDAVEEPLALHLRDLYTESGETLQSSFSAVSKPNLQENMRWKALAEIFTMHSFAPFLESIIENWGKKNLAKTTPKR